MPEHLTDRDAKRFGFVPIDCGEQLRDGGAEWRESSSDRGLGFCIVYEPGRDALQLGKIDIAVPQFDLHREAAGIAYPLDGRRRHHNGVRLQDMLIEGSL
jgi:hypothetical protein